MDTGTVRHTTRQQTGTSLASLARFVLAALGVLWFVLWLAATLVLAAGERPKTVAAALAAPRDVVSHQTARRIAPHSSSPESARGNVGLPQPMPSRSRGSFSLAPEELAYDTQARESEGHGQPAGNEGDRANTGTVRGQTLAHEPLAHGRRTREFIVTSGHATHVPSLGQRSPRDERSSRAADADVGTEDHTASSSLRGIEDRIGDHRGTSAEGVSGVSGVRQKVNAVVRQNVSKDVYKPLHPGLAEGFSAPPSGPRWRGAMVARNCGLVAPGRSLRAVAQDVSVHILVPAAVGGVFSAVRRSWRGFYVYKAVRGWLLGVRVYT